MRAKQDERIERLLTRTVEKVIERPHLEAALRSGKKLRVKLGIDPTGEKIHIGRAIALWKLREFQELEHKIVLIIGDFTAQIGDPSDKLEKRPFLTKEQVKKNLKEYLPQIGKVLDLKKAEVRYNSEWLSKLNFREVSELAELFTFQQILERRNFRERWEKHKEISYREGMYALMQGYDSVVVKADVELGGSDQLFNLLAGRKVQMYYGQKPQDIMTTKMLSGTDGRKMTTTWGNVINIIDPPDEQFGKVMAMRDEMVVDYFRMATRLSEKEIAAYEKESKQGANPRDVKLTLAREIVALYHGRKAGEKAAEKWKKIFSKKEISATGLPALKIGILLGWMPDDLVLRSGVVKSRSAAWRLIEQGGFEFNGKKITDPRANNVILHEGDVIRIGKKNFFRIEY